MTAMGIALFLVCLPCIARAQNQEPAGINLGGTSFFDGFGRDSGGFTAIDYLVWTNSDRINGKEPVPNTEQTAKQASQRSPYFINPRFDIITHLRQIIYTLPYKIFNVAYAGVDFIVPFVGFMTSFEEKTASTAGVGSKLTHNGIGIGDLTFGPMLQFRPVIVDGRPLFSNRIELDFIAPTGDYNPYKDLNQGANFTSFNPYWAGTIVPVPFIELSVRVNYLYNFKNYHPALNFRDNTGKKVFLEAASRIKSSQAGQAGWLNFAASLELFPNLIPVDTATSLSIGVNGYYFQQFNLDIWELEDPATQSVYTEPGYELHDTGKAKLLALGPGIFFKAGRHDKFTANLYFQLIAENKAQCTVTNVRWVHGF
jgi:hypothetical protein